MTRVRVMATTGAIAAALAVAACGEDDDEEAASAATLEIVATESGETSALEVPDSAEAGLTEITLTNDGERPHSAQLLRVEGEHDEAEVREALGLAMQGKAFPDWFFGGGGAGTVAPGESATVTQELEDGSTYWVVDDEENREPPLAAIEITGESDGGDLPATENTVTAVDFGFEAGALTAGEAVTFENTGEQPHHMIAVPIVDEAATIDDVEQFLKEEEEEGKPPVDFESGEFTSVLEGGTSQVSAATLDPGRYALVCFISNREGGPPHVQLGMIDEVEVE